MHTPGPWKVDKYDNVVDSKGSIIRLTGFALASGHVPRLDEAYSNRDLVSTAPEMLDMLIELQECAQYWSEYDVPLGIVDRLNAVIEKAKRGDGE